VRPDSWFRNAIVYCLSVDTFFDANGDGIGDLAGLTAKLDYLESLGVDVLWLTPTQPSPWRDDGYDITDHYGVDPRLGTSGDFVEMVHEAAARGIRIVPDLVVNHTSDRHPWFLEARSDRNSRRREWYVWSEKRPRDLSSGVVFPGVQKTTWSYARETRSWYFHRFYDFQPDLNMDDPRVRTEIDRIVRYWLQLGAAGFRMDAVPFVIEKAAPGGGEPKLHFEYLRALRQHLQWQKGDAILLGEANVVPRDDAEYFADGHGLHMLFNFWVNQHLFAALATSDARLLARALEQTRRIPQQSQWAHFLRNHDELDLGRLPETLRARVFEAFGPEPSMQLYGRGIRRRLAPMLGDRARLELAYSLLFALPGTPVLRYGEEIGMGENLRLKERNAIRTPMQWANAPGAGFSTSAELVRPVIDSGPYSFEAVSVEQQLRDPTSLLRRLTELVRVRKECPEVGRGDWRVVATRNQAVLALEHRFDRTGVLCVHNLGPDAAEVALRVEAPVLESLLGPETSRGVRGRHRLRLEPYGYAWFRAA
jgi:maltose alpha-D-glucosyltransferase / alpha-amylase